MKARTNRSAPARRSRRRLAVRFGPGTRLSLEVDLAPRAVRLRGLVVWTRAGDPRWIATGRVEMGLKFIDPPNNLMDLVSPLTLPG